MDWKRCLQELHIPFEEHVDLKKRTWIHRGGTAHFYVMPESVEQLSELVRRLYAQKALFTLVGHTSNLYIRNSTNLGIVISTIHLTQVREENGIYICDCGVAIAPLARQAIAKGQVGYEGLVNLPGTVGSAAVNNAGCFQCSISDLLIEAEVLFEDGQIRTISKEQFDYSERSSAFKRGDQQGVLLRVKLACDRLGDKESLLQKAEANTLYRKTRQEGPKQNLGSTFPIYVMEAFYRHLPPHTKLCLIVSAKLHQIVGKKRSQKSVNAIILSTNGLYCRLHRYISQHNFGCFVWRDAGADKAFITYRSFVAKTAGMTDIEIEVL